MRITNKYCVNNDCYKNGKKLSSVSHLIVHSTAVLPAVIRAVDGSNNWFKRWNKPGIEKLAHGFIDDTGVYQFAPENMRCWHIGNTWGNSNCIGYEWCELDTREAFEAEWNNAVELYAELCVKCGLPESAVIGHCEAHDMGFASNHSDPVPYFKIYGRNMDDFRKAVAAEIINLKSAAEDDKIEPLDGYIKIIYAGADGVEVHNTPDFSAASRNRKYGPVGPSTGKGTKFTVTGRVAVEGGTMYRLKSGLYITANERYVRFEPK